jgi:hypothetical protein
MAAAIQLLLKTAVWVLPYDACEAEMKTLKRCVSDSWSYCFFFFFASRQHQLLPLDMERATELL